MQIFGRDIRPRTALNRWGQIIKDVSNPEIPYARKSPANYYGNADRSFAYLASQPGIGDALEFAVDNPYAAAAALAGGTVVNNLVGNPVGGTIDFLSMGLTNLKPDEYQQLSPQDVEFIQKTNPTKPLSEYDDRTQALGELLAIPAVRDNPQVKALYAKYAMQKYPGLRESDLLGSQPGVQPNQVQIPELNEEERAKFMKYTTNRTAQQVLTYQALQDFLSQQPGMEGYQ